MMNNPVPFSSLALLVTAATIVPVSGHAEEPSAAQVIEAFEANFGVHPGQRRNHTKGMCAVGEFTASPAGHALSRSAVFSGKSVPVVARFSLAGGNPKAPDTARSPRGMALQFRLPDGKLHQMAMLNTPVFGAATPTMFLDATQAARPDPATGKADPARIKAFLEANPPARAQAEFLATHNPPASYATSSYFGLNAFRVTNEAGKTEWVRWKFEPAGGEKRLSADEMTKSSPDFLQDELITRVTKKPARWTMIVTLGGKGDTTTDPTQAWPKGRRTVRAGELVIRRAMPQAGAECEGINYDPMVLSDGVEASDDPVLRFRSPAYAVSFGKRVSEQPASPPED